MDGWLHISELEHRHVARVEDVLKMRDEVEVKVLSIESDGKVRLSRKALLTNDNPEGDSGGQERSYRGPRRDGNRGRERSRN